MALVRLSRSDTARPIDASLTLLARPNDTIAARGGTGIIVIASVGIVGTEIWTAIVVSGRRIGIGIARLYGEVLADGTLLPDIDTKIVAEQA